MATLRLENIDDFTQRVLARYLRNAYVDVSLGLQKYIWGSKFFNSKKRAERGGKYLAWKLRKANQNSGKNTGPYAVDETNRVNVLLEAHEGWSHQSFNYIYDLTEDDFSSPDETLVRRIDVDEQGLTNDAVTFMESAMWSRPSSTTADPMPPSGIPHWVIKNATEGFTGTYNSDYGDVIGNVATATVPNWRNYSGDYLQVSRDDLIEKVVNACDFCLFEAPADFPQLDKGPPDWAFFTVHSVLATMRKILSTGNDNLGPDVARWAGAVMIRGVPVTWVPALTNSESEVYDSSAPFYGINFTSFEYFFKSGWSMIKRPPKQAPNQDTVRIRMMHNIGNFVCYDRRSNFVFYVA